MMSVTEEQKAYHLRKMRTRVTRVDVNKDGFISREDYEIMGKRWIEFGGVTDEQAETLRKAYEFLVNSYGLLPGVKIPIEEAAERVSKAILSNTHEATKAMFYKGFNILFDIIDTNKDGRISVEEFKVYFQVMASGISEEEITRCFNIIDADKNGEISREEFVAAAEEFYFGLEEAELSNAFYGPLLS